MRVTIDGQVEIPNDVRKKLYITPETEIEFIEENGRFYLVNLSVLQPRPGRFRNLRGIATVKMSTDDIMRMTRGE